MTIDEGPVFYGEAEIWSLPTRPEAASCRPGKPEGSADAPRAASTKLVAIVMDLLRKLAREHEATIIAVTHDEKIYDRLDRVYKLRDGQLIETEERAAERSALPQGHPLSGPYRSARSDPTDSAGGEA